MLHFEGMKQIQCQSVMARRDPQVERLQAEAKFLRELPKGQRSHALELLRASPRTRKRK